jgi:hypothetical protein
MNSKWHVEFYRRLVIRRAKRSFAICCLPFAILLLLSACDSAAAPTNPAFTIVDFRRKLRFWNL